jgi:phosphatidylglycerophosphatase A
MDVPHFINRLKLSISTVAGIGLLPKMPGTFGSAAVFIIIFFPLANPSLTFLILACASFLLGLWAVPVAEQHWGHDAGCIVIDEVLGMSFTLASPIIPHSWGWLLLAFILFRFFDIVKPYPINRLNAKHGAVFVMVDDILASFYALLVLHGAWLIYQLFDFR